MVDILSLLDQAATQYSFLPATINEHRQTSFSELAHSVTHTKSQLLAKGLALGHTVVLRIGQSDMFPQALLGAWLAGLRVAMINPALPDEIARILMVQCNANALITVKEREEVTRLHIEEVQTTKQISDPAAQDDGRGWNDPDREVLIVFSSGSTGVPKGILHSWRTLGALLLHTFELYPRAIDLFSVPLAGLGGVQMLALSLRDGLPLRVLNDLSPHGIVHAISEIKPRHVLLFPALISAWVAAAADQPSLLTSVEICHSGGDRLSSALHHTFKQLSGVAIMHAYGMAECGPILKSDEDNPSLMRPISQTSIHLALRSLQEHHNAEGKAGELIVYSPSLMTRYLGQKNAMPQGSAFSTGELFQTVGQNGFLHIGRVSDRLHNLQTHWIEESVRRRLGPRSQVCALDDGGVLKIFVSGINALHDDLLEQLRKDPDVDLRTWRDVFLIALPSLPLGPTGKVDRVALNRLSN